MYQRLAPLLILVTSIQSGCMSLDSFTRLSNRQSDQRGVEDPLDFSFNLNDPAERQAVPASLDHEILRLAIANTRTGSIVSVSNEIGHQFHGILFKKSPNSVELMNCIGKEVVPGPDGRDQCKTTHVPFQSFGISTLLHFASHVSASKKKPVREIRYDTGNVTVDALIFKSGRRLRWSEPPVPSELDDDPDSPEKLQTGIAAIARGSHVFIVDESGQRFNGILMHSDPQRVELMNCLWRETVPGTDGQTQCKTNHIAFQSFDTASLQSFGIVSPPPQGLDVAELGEDSCELCIDKFAYQSDRR